MMETTLGNWPRDQNPETTTAALDQPPLCWSNKYNLRELSCDNNMDLINEALFSSSSGVLVLEEAPGTKTSINSNIIASNYSNISNWNNNIVGREEEVVAAPGPEYYSINGAASNLNLSSQRGQDAARVGGIILAKYNWEYSSPSQPPPPPPLDFIADSLNGGVEASNSSIGRPLISNGVLGEDDSSNYKVVRFSADHHHQSSSLDNCNLLSASNSGTDKSVEDDDGISLLFSDCNHLYNWNNLSAASSGESEINNTSNYCEITSKDHHLPPADETTLISQTSETGTTSKRSHGGDLLQWRSKGSTDREGGFRLIDSENVPSRWSKKPRSEKAGHNQKYRCSNNISFRHPNSSGSNSGSGEDQEPDTEAIAQMKEMIYRAAAFRPVNFGLEAVDQKPKRKNVRISSDPQTVAARQRRERISQRIRVLQRLVPGGSKMDTASMLDEAANYLKFLKSQVTALEKIGGHTQLDYSSSSTNNNYATSLTFSPNFIDHTILPMQTFLPHHHKP